MGRGSQCIRSILVKYISKLIFGHTELGPPDQNSCFLLGEVRPLASLFPPSMSKYKMTNLQRASPAAQLKVRRGAPLIGEDLTRLCQTHSTPFSPPPVSLPPSLLPLCRLRRWEGRGEGLRWSKSDCAAHQSCEMDLGHTPLAWRSCADVRLHLV